MLLLQQIVIDVLQIERGLELTAESKANGKTSRVYFRSTAGLNRNEA